MEFQQVDLNYSLLYKNKFLFIIFPLVVLCLISIIINSYVVSEVKEELLSNVLEEEQLQKKLSELENSRKEIDNNIEANKWVNKSNYIAKCLPDENSLEELIELLVKKAFNLNIVVKKMNILKKKYSEEINYLPINLSLRGDVKSMLKYLNYIIELDYTISIVELQLRRNKFGVELGAKLQIYFK